MSESNPTKREARRAAQAANAAQADRDAHLVPGPGVDNSAEVTAREQQTLARFGTTNPTARQMRQDRQQRNAAESDAEAGNVPDQIDDDEETLGSAAPILANIQGRQPTLHELNQIAQRADQAIKDDNREAMQAAAKAGYDVLIGHPQRSRHTRLKRANKAQIALAEARAAKA